MIDWDKANLEEFELAGKIAKRAAKELPALDAHSVSMDIIATHVGGCKLKLKELFQADLGNFLHDVCGIARHLDRETGKLTNCFLPRYAQ